MAAGKNSRKKGRHRRKRPETEAYVHWLSAGAVAMGLGAAVATGHGVAAAQPPTSDGSTASSDEAGPPKSDGATEPKAGSTTEAASEPRTPKSDPDSTTTAGDSPKTTVSASTVEITKTEEDNRDSDSQSADPKTAPTAKDDEPRHDTDKPTAKPTADTVKKATHANTPATASVTSRTTTPEAESVTETAAPPSTPQAPKLSQASTSSTSVTAVSAPAAAPAVANTPVTVRSIVTDVLTWLSLPPLAEDSPIPPAPVPAIVESLWLAVRQVQYGVNNRLPVARPTLTGQDPLTGVTTGRLNAVDYDGDQLTYTVTTAPANGTVNLDAAGNFTYTPDADEAELGGQDAFIVAIDDRIGNPPHLHGLLDLFGVVRPTTATVRITVDPVNHPPAVTVTPTGAPDPTNGSIVYQIVVTDPDAGDIPVVTITDAPDHGTLVADEEGAYTYTPDRAYAHAIGAGGPDVDSFTVTADDGRGGVTSQTESVVVAFVNAAPEASADAGNPHPQNGAIAGTVTGSDTDGDDVAYAVGVPPEKGSLTVDPATGEWVYTPSLDARVAAAAVNATPEAKQDAFTVTVSDGYTETVVSVTVSVVAPHNTLTANVPLSQPGQYQHIATLSADGEYFYVLNGDRNVVQIVDTATYAVTDIPIPGTVFGVGASPDGTRLYVASSDTYMRVIDTATNTVTATVPLGNIPYSPVVSPDGDRVYIPIPQENKVTVVNAATNTVEATITIGAPFAYYTAEGPLFAAISPDGSHLYVVNKFDDVDGNVSVIDTATNTVTATVGVGRLPFGIAVSPDGTRVYVTNNADGTVSVIDTDTDTVTDTIAVGGGAFGVAVSADGTRAYVSHWMVFTPGEDVVSVIDTTTNRVIASIPLDPATYDEAGSGQIAVSPDGTHVYVAPFLKGVASVISVLPSGEAYSNTAPSVVSVNNGPDPQTAIVTGTVTGTDPDGDPLHYIVTDSAAKGSVTVDRTTGAWTYTPSLAARIQGANGTEEDRQDTFTISASDLYEATPVVITVDIAPLYIDVVDTIGVGDFPQDIAISPNGARVYVTNHGPDTVSVIDTATNTVVATVPVGTNPDGVAVSPDGSRAYVVNFSDAKISIIDTASNTVGATITVPLGAQNVAFSPVESQARAYVAAFDEVAVIDTVSNTVIDTIPLDGLKGDLAVSPDGSRIYVSVFGEDEVAVIDTATNTVIRSIPVGSFPDDIAVSPDGTRVYVSDDEVTVIDATTYTVITTIDVPSARGVAVSPDGAAVFVANINFDSLSVIETASNTVVATVDGADGPWRMVVSGDGTRAYVVNLNDDSVSVIALTTVVL